MIIVGRRDFLLHIKAATWMVRIDRIKGVANEQANFTSPQIMRPNSSRNLLADLSNDDLDLPLVIVVAIQDLRIAVAFGFRDIFIPDDATVNAPTHGIELLANYAELSFHNCWIRVGEVVHVVDA